MAFQYDVAISYAAPDRPLAEQLATMLKNRGLTVFFDLFEQDKIWGRSLYQFLGEVYETKARFCIVLISEHYRDRIWTRHEIQAAFNRAATQRTEYILPIRLDDTVIDGLPKDLAYISLRTCPLEQIVEVFVKKCATDLISNSTTDISEFVDTFYETRNQAIQRAIMELEHEARGIWFVCTTMYRVLVANTGPMGEPLLKVLQKKANAGEIAVRVIMANSQSLEFRSVPEGRADGALLREQRQSSSFLRTHLPVAEVRYAATAPTYFAILLSELLLISSYPYTAEAYNAFTLAVKNLHFLTNDCPSLAFQN